MTEKELNSLYYISQRIKTLKRRIAELDPEIGIGSSAMNGMPHGSGVSNPLETLVMKKVALEDDLSKELSLKLDEERKIQNYISAVDDEEIRLIMELRFIHLMKWQDIGTQIHSDRTTAYRKIKKYLSES